MNTRYSITVVYCCDFRTAQIYDFYCVAVNLIMLIIRLIYRRKWEIVAKWIHVHALNVQIYMLVMYVPPKVAKVL